MARTFEWPHARLDEARPPNLTLVETTRDRDLRDNAIAVGLLWLTGLVQVLIGLGGSSSYIRDCGIGLLLLAVAWTVHHRVLRRRMQRRS